MPNYTPDEARAALADVDLRRRQLAAAVGPMLFWPVTNLIVWMVGGALLLDLPSTSLTRPLYLGLTALYLAGVVWFGYRGRVRARLSLFTPIWWVLLIAGAAGGVAVWEAVRSAVDSHTDLPATFAALAFSLYLALFALLVNHVLARRAAAAPR